MNEVLGRSMNTASSSTDAQPRTQQDLEACLPILAWINRDKQKGTTWENLQSSHPLPERQRAHYLRCLRIAKNAITEEDDTQEVLTQEQPEQHNADNEVTNSTTSVASDEDTEDETHSRKVDQRDHATICRRVCEGFIGRSCAAKCIPTIAHSGPCACVQHSPTIAELILASKTNPPAARCTQKHNHMADHTQGTGQATVSQILASPHPMRHEAIKAVKTNIEEMKTHLQYLCNFVNEIAYKEVYNPIQKYVSTTQRDLTKCLEGTLEYANHLYRHLTTERRGHDIYEQLRTLPPRCSCWKRNRRKKTQKRRTWYGGSSNTRRH